MPPDQAHDDDATAWLARAASNLYRSSERTSDLVLLEDLCFDAQQAAEKAIKAVLVDLGVEFPYVHDLGQLLERARPARIDVPDEVGRAVALTPYAVVTRYPGVVGPVSEADHREAVRVAETVYSWAEKQLRR